MEVKNIKDFFNTIEEFNSILQSIPVRKLVKQTDKDFIKKMKKYLKEYGENMTMLESQYKRIILLREEVL
jgi:uncharacterized protein (DUF1499 family)|nr:MAG TPA: hypothetical protein [Caudoviricetes sp.]